MPVGLYLRVSTGEQTVTNQERELAEAAQRHGWEVVAIYRDEGVSGAKGREKRPGFDRLCKAIVRREVDMVAAWSVDRLGRSLQDLVGFLAELQATGEPLCTFISKGSTPLPRRGGPYSACSQSSRIASGQ